MRGERAVETHGGIKSQRRHISGKPWGKSSGKPGGGDGVRGSCSRVQGRQQGKVSGDLENLGQRQATPSWDYYPVWGVEMMGWRQEAPRW